MSVYLSVFASFCFVFRCFPGEQNKFVRQESVDIILRTRQSAEQINGSPNSNRNWKVMSNTLHILYQVRLECSILSLKWKQGTSASVWNIYFALVVPANVCTRVCIYAHWALQHSTFFPFNDFHLELLQSAASVKSRRTDAVERAHHTLADDVNINDFCRRGNVQRSTELLTLNNAVRLRFFIPVTKLCQSSFPSWRPVYTQPETMARNFKFGKNVDRVYSRFNHWRETHLNTSRIHKHKSVTVTARCPLCICRGLRMAMAMDQKRLNERLSK